MVKIKATLLWFLLVPMVFVIPVVSIGCTVNDATGTGIPISGSWDLYSLSTAIENNAANNTGVPSVTMTPSANSIDELKNGKCDAILLESDPTADELQGLKDY